MSAWYRLVVLVFYLIGVVSMYSGLVMDGIYIFILSYPPNILLG